MHVRMAACVMAAIVSFSCSDSRPTSPTPVAAPQPSPASIRVSGRVVDYVSGKSIPGYTVQWWTGSNSHLMLRVGQLTSVTDAAGRFAIDVPVTDDFTPLTDTLLFENPQHELSGSIRIPSKSVETDLLVNPGGCNVRYGYVYDAVTRQPIAGARVVRRNAAITDGNGFYRLEIVCNAPAGQSFGIGTTTLGVSHPAYRGTSVIDGRSEWTGLPGINRVDFALQPLQ